MGPCLTWIYGARLLKLIVRVICKVGAKLLGVINSLPLAPVRRPFSQTRFYPSTNLNLLEDKIYGLEVEDFGVQTITLSAENPLLLFDLDISLEWDARNDPLYLGQLEADLKRTSELLFDLSDGQAALGQLRVYQNKANWLDSHILIQANNNLRPNADLGGIVGQTLTKTFGLDSQVITTTYDPGQVRMGPTWSRFGGPSNDTGEDWPRALAHELGHYLFFMLDNYLGQDENKRIKAVDCPGSAMSDPYLESEWLNSDNPLWQTPGCQETLAQQYLGLADWDILQNFYPQLQKNRLSPGPNILPLELTQVQFVQATSNITTSTLDAPFYDILDENGERLFLPAGQSQAYLLKGQQTSTLEDDWVLPLGSANRDFVYARGAKVDDQLCLFDQSQDRFRLGCLPSLAANSTALNLYEADNWPPQISVSPVNSKSLSITSTNLAITLSQVVDQDLLIQVFPTVGPPSAALPLSQSQVGSQTLWIQGVDLISPTLSGHIRVWSPGAVQVREYILPFNVGGWQTGRRGWHTGRRGWHTGRRGWHAPISSEDGQVIIFPSDIFADIGAHTLQQIPRPQDLPAWLTPVGQVYRFSNAYALPSSSISFQYLQRDVVGYEGNLSLYYQAEGEQGWQKLATSIDEQRNLATAALPWEGANRAGTFALIATQELPALNIGWNILSYPLNQSQAITQALASIAGSYSIIYQDQGNSQPRWRLYDPDVLAQHPEFDGFVNELRTLEPLGSYWLHATEAVTPTLGLGRDPETLDLAFPPAIFYGWLSSPLGMNATLEAWIDGQLCGQATLAEIKGQVAYKLAVRMARPGEVSCGVDGDTVQFRLNGKVLTETAGWLAVVDDCSAN